jgi:hypothetical protein
MKHIKTSNQFLHGGTYTKMDDEDFDNDRDRLKETGKVDYFTLSELKWFKDKGIYLNGYTTKDTELVIRAGYSFNDQGILGLYLNKWGYYIRIWKYVDEWYYVITGRHGESTTTDMEFRKYFKCDQFDGLQSLVELWIRYRGNLKSKHLR